MATTEKTEVVETKADPVVEVQPQAEVQPAIGQTTVKEPMSRQTIITVSILSAVILFFLGLGLGFLIGNRVANRLDAGGSRVYNQSRLPGGMMRRGYYQDDTQTTPSTGSTNNSTQTN